LLGFLYGVLEWLRSQDVTGITVTFIVPQGFRGEVLVFTKEPGGKEVSKFEDKEIYEVRIAPDGVVKLKENPLEKSVKVAAHFENGQPIPLGITAAKGQLAFWFDGNDDNGVCISLLVPKKKERRSARKRMHETEENHKALEEKGCVRGEN